MNKSKMLQDMYDRHYKKPSKPNTIEGVYDGLLESVRRVDNFPKPESQPNEQVVYKLKHKPTGLFYSPQGKFANLDTLGRVYNNPPARLGWYAFPNSSLGEPVRKRITCSLDTWEVIEYKLVELSKGE